MSSLATLDQIINHQSKYDDTPLDKTDYKPSQYGCGCADMNNRIMKQRHYYKLQWNINEIDQYIPNTIRPMLLQILNDYDKMFEIKQEENK